MIIKDRKQAIQTIINYTPIKLYFLGDTKYKRVYTAAFINHTGDIIYLITKIGRELTINTFKSEVNQYSHSINN